MENFSYIKKNLNPVALDHVEENTTFYYSNFKLFHDNSELLFASYLSFKKNLQAFLGEDWEIYAKRTIFNTIDGSTIFVQSRDVFSTALEVWLELRNKLDFGEEDVHGNATKRPILQIIPNDEGENKENLRELEEEKDLEKGDIQKSYAKISQVIEEKNKSQDENMTKNCEKNSTQNSENSGEDLKAFEVFYKEVRAKFTENHINEAFFRAVVQAFYISAIKVWKTTKDTYSCDAFFGCENTSLLTESKRFLLNKLQNVYKTKFKMLKPILVATERIKDYIYKDSNKLFGNSQIQVMDDKDRKNITNFSSSIQFENSSHYKIPINVLQPKTDDDEQDLKLNFNNLRINSNESGSVLGKRSAFQAHSVVEIRKSNKKFEKLLNQNTIEFAAHYVNNMKKASGLDWQISRSFVTNMVEVNYNKLVQLENRLTSKADGVKNDVKIRFIQPAQEFYNRLMEVWIIFKTNSLNKEVLFTEYLDKVKTSLGQLWNDRFLTPTHNFFMTLYYEWHHLKQIENDTEEKILLFTKKVKESMLKTWEDNIVKKAEELTNKTISAPNRV